jgi:O-methyltransferase involved in polyketide biosynthesis
MAADSSGISFTALYTGEVWRRHGLSVPFLSTPKGRLLYAALRPFELGARLLLGVSNEEMLLQRHQILDHLLERAVADEGVTQVVEIACGLSPRGTRVSRRFASVSYVEADLPDMAARKRRLLEAAGELGPSHRVVDLDILDSDSPRSLETVFSRELDHSRKTLVITEGLVNYFDYPTIHGFWTRLATALKPFPGGSYLTDLYPGSRRRRANRAVSAFQVTLARATRSRVTLHFTDENSIREGFRAAGFSSTVVHRPESYFGVLPIPVHSAPSLVRVIENRV